MDARPRAATAAGRCRRHRERRFASGRGQGSLVRPTGFHAAPAPIVTARPAAPACAAYVARVRVHAGRGPNRPAFPPPAWPAAPPVASAVASRVKGRSPTRVLACGCGPHQSASLRPAGTSLDTAPAPASHGSRSKADATVPVAALSALPNPKGKRDDYSQTVCR